MNKRKAVLYGLGKLFNSHYGLLEQVFDIVAVSDQYKPDNECYIKLYKPIDEVKGTDYDNLVICSKKYRDSIIVKLYKAGFDLDKVVYIDDIVNAFSSGAKDKYEEIIKDMDGYESACENQFVVGDDSLMLLNDKRGNAGAPAAHYFAQDIWAAKKVWQRNPKEHYDIGSRLDGFIAHLLTFREINYIDIRPLPYRIEGLNFVMGDATNLSTIKDGSLESVSCLHAMEHFGLGRYGDNIDPDGFKKFSVGIRRVLKPGGILLIGVPVGPKDRCVFNAHRIFSIKTLLALFDDFKLNDIGIIGPEDVNVSHICEDEYESVKDYSCGVFEFEKP